MIALSLLVALVAALVAVAPSSQAAPVSSTRSADRPYSGFRVSSTSSAIRGSAADDWIGARRFRTVVYRIDPAQRVETSKSFYSPRYVSELVRSGKGVGQRNTARAAWIVSKYGSVRYNVQAAAVEVALNHLLVGGSYSLGGNRTASRLAASGRADDIREFARTMLAQSTNFAGPYQLTAQATGTQVGGAAKFSFRVSSSVTRNPIARIPIVLRWPGKTPIKLVTDDNGRATTSVVTGSAGEKKVQVTFDRIPETRLRVRTPTTTGASRVVISGSKRTFHKTLSVPVQATPTVKVNATTSVDAGKNAPGTFTITDAATTTGADGQTTPHTVTGTLYGPFSDPALMQCTDAHKAASAQTQVSIDGSGPNTFDLPAIKVDLEGYYTWSVISPANRLNTRAEACEAVTTAKKVASLNVERVERDVKVGDSIRAGVGVYGVRQGYNGSGVTVELFGPYEYQSGIACSPALRFSASRTEITQSGSFTAPAVTVTKPGLYAWRAVLSGDSLQRSKTSACKAENTLVRVR